MRARPTLPVRTLVEFMPARRASNGAYPPRISMARSRKKETCSERPRRSPGVVLTWRGAGDLIFIHGSADGKHAFKYGEVSIRRCPQSLLCSPSS